MKKSYLLVLACFVALPLFAAVKHDNYITSSSGNLYSYYSNWTPGSAIPNAEEDENFFIGRQRPLIRFTNTESDPIASETKRNQRKFMWWCPINEGGWTSLPRYCFDSEVFNMWSYVDIYGNWTQGFLRNPGAFTDVCHKNGVATEVVSAAAWGVSLSSTDGGHGQNYSALASGGADKLMKMFRYYGIDGLGFNSEQTWGMRSDMKTLFTNCHSKRTTYNVPLLHFGMYNLSSALYNQTSGSGTEFSDFFPYANAFFLNYNWGSGTLSTAASNANSMASSAGLSSYVNSYDVYAGMDMQGGTAGFHWSYINSNAVSVGIWGAHNKNMLYQGSNADGSTAKAIQTCYLRHSEQFFTGGTQNPVNNLTVSDGKCAPSATFHGVNKLVAAKSALSWNTNSYFPFITYFNLGNGQFFKMEGETTYNNEWYNIGLQDFLPTWRWWITTAWRGRQTSQVPSDTHATFTWDDAWFGGSCMKITFDDAVTGSNARFIHLFKTDFPLTNSDTWKLRIRYKVLSGSAVGFFAMSATGTETSAVTASIGTMSGATWQVKEVAVPSGMVGKTMAMLGLQFRNIAAGTEILVGEMALYKEGVTYTPICPTLAQTKILKVTSKGVDFKTTWNSHIDGTSTAVASDETCHTSGSSTITYQNPVVRNTSVCTMSGSMTNGGRRLSSINVKRGYTTVLSATTIQTSNYASIYTDKTGTTINVTAGTQYTLNATYSGQWMQGALFIDLNNDGDFTDDGELMSYDTTNDGTFQTAYTFTVPSSATNGTYTLRFVVLWYDNVSEIPAASCGQSSMAQNGGSITDFTINVTGGSGTGLPIETVTEGTSEGSPAVYHPSGRNAWEPVYNDEVGTWYFEVWGQQCGEEPHLITCTTSWAAYGVEAPINIDGTLSYRVGVRAVAPDGVTKSDIQWSSYLVASNVSVLEGIVVDKPVIKPNETFTLSFDDSQHEACNWEVIECATGTTVATATDVKSFTINGLSNLGSYDVKVCGKTYPAFIIISPEATGALPEIYTLTANKNDIEPNETATVSYTSRDADGTVSKGLKVGDPFAFTARVNSTLASTASSTEFCKTAPYTYCMWFKATEFTHGTQGTNLLYKTDYTCDWPQNNWGEFWVLMRPEGHSCSTVESSNDGTYKCYANELSFNVTGWGLHGAARAYMTSRCAIEPGSWYHVAVALNTDGYETMWLNGKQVAYSQDTYVYGNGCQSGYNENSNAFTRKFCRLYVGATNTYKGGFNGVIDEIQVWDKVLTTSEVQQAMMGYQKGSVPSNLKGYWTFEELEQKAIPSGVDETDSTFLVYPNWGTGGDFAVAYYSTTPKINDNPTNTSTMLYEPMYGDQPDAGCPLISGSYVIETTPSWRSVGGSGSIVKGGNTATAGNATVSNDEECSPFRVYLKLTNSWGSSSEQYVDLIVSLHTGLKGVEALQGAEVSVYPNPFVNHLRIAFADAGRYNLLLWDGNGRCMNVRTVEVSSGEVMDFEVEGEKGLYVLEVRHDDKVVRAVKMEKR